MVLILLVVLLVLAVGGLPTWGYHPYGYGPSSVVGVVLMVLLVLLLVGRV